MAHPSSAPTLCFGTTTFHPITIDGQIWLRLPQIGVALGYQSPYKLQQVFERNAAEFTEHMTRVVKAPTAGGLQDVRIFSLRGAHLLGMLARTARAAEFRRWVLDVLDRTTATTPALPPAALPAEDLERTDYRTQASALALRYVQALSNGQQPTWPEAQARQLADGIVHAWLLRDARWLMSFDPTGRLQLQRLEPGQQLVDTLNPEALQRLVRHAIPTQHLAALAHAAIEALEQHAQKGAAA